MAYCTQTDIVTIYGNPAICRWSSFVTPTPATPDAVRIPAAIKYASARIDGHLANSQYVTPIVGTTIDPPSLINEIAATLAGYWLYNTRNEHATKEMDADMEKKRAMCYQQLEAILTGRLPLLAASNTQTQAPFVVGGGCGGGGRCW
jgi:phage gp36-like protein